MKKDSNKEKKPAQSRRRQRREVRVKNKDKNKVKGEEEEVGRNVSVMRLLCRMIMPVKKGMARMGRI